MKQSTISNDLRLIKEATNSCSRQTIQLNYGNGRQEFSYDPEQFQILMPVDSLYKDYQEVDLDIAFANPIASQKLEEIVASRDTVLIVAPDATRAVGADRIIPILVDRLKKIGLNINQISVLIGGGIHRPPTDKEIEKIVGVQTSKLLAIQKHNAFEKSSLVHVGETSRGTPVEVNRRLVEADRIILIGGIGFHYCAGFSGGRKAILPGCASELSIRSHHLLSFDTARLEQRADVITGCLDGNPVHENILEAAAMLKPSFLINTIVNSENEIIRTYTGDYDKAHRQGCREYADLYTAKISAKRRLVIVSCGGFPRDINLIQSHKAIEHASSALAEGGSMIVLAECSSGLGRDDFLDWFVPGGSQSTAKRLIANYHVNGQTAWGLRSKAERFRILFVSSLDPTVISKMGMEPFNSLQSALETIPSETGYILPNGITTLPSLC